MILRTFSKMASLAGLRVGYAMADPDCIALMNRIRQPFNVNTLAQVGALAALDDEAYIQRSVEAAREGVRSVSAALDAPGRPLRAEPRELHPGRVRRCDARVTSGSSSSGVMVRPMTSFGLERALRITVGTPEENARLVDALRAVLGKGAGCA